MAVRPENPPVIRFPGGMNNRAPETAVPEGQARLLENVDVDADGRISRRDGATLIQAADAHSFWATEELAFALVVADGQLNRFDVNETLTPLAAVRPQAPLSYALFAGQVYWSNGFEQGRVSALGAAGEWGVEQPNAQPVAQVAAGALRPATYRVAITYRTASGEESAPSPLLYVTLGAVGGIHLASIPQPASAAVTSIRIYLSPGDEEALYHNRDVAVGMSEATLLEGVRGRRLDTLGLQRTPPGHLVRAYAGRLWVAAGNVLWFTEAGKPGLYRPASGFFQYAERVRLVAPVSDGLFVCADRTYFLEGAKPSEMRQRYVEFASAVENTDLRAPPHPFGLEQVPTGGMLWLADDGRFRLGLPGGQVLVIAGERLAVPAGDRGASAYRLAASGVPQLLTVTGDSGGVNRLTANDTAVATVIRNGITL